MERIFGKENMLDWLQNYGLTIVIAGAFVVLLASPETGFVNAIFGLTIMYFWVYFVHRALHFLPREGPYRFINTHWIFHHETTKVLPRWLELVIETFNDLSMGLSFLLIQNLTGLKLVPPSIILFYTIWYTSVHIVNYSIIGSETHKDHHLNVDTNYGPDVIDQLFGTNHRPEKEDILNLVPNTLFSFAAVYLLKQRFNWIY